LCVCADFRRQIALVAQGDTSLFRVPFKYLLDACSDGRRASQIYIWIAKVRNLTLRAGLKDRRFKPLKPTLLHFLTEFDDASEGIGQLTLQSS
jgi:hypothetical protein